MQTRGIMTLHTSATKHAKSTPLNCASQSARPAAQSREGLRCCSHRSLPAPAPVTPARPPGRAPRRASACAARRQQRRHIACTQTRANAGQTTSIDLSKVAGSAAMADQLCFACLLSPHTLTGVAERPRRMRCSGRARLQVMVGAGTWLRSAASAASSASTAASAAGSAGEGSAGAAPGSSSPTGTCRLLASAAVSNAASCRASRACSRACSAAEACAPGTATRLQNRTGCRHLESCGWGALPVRVTEG